MRQVRSTGARILLLALLFFVLSEEAGLRDASSGSLDEARTARLAGVPDPVVEVVRMEVGDSDLMAIEKTGDAYLLTWNAGEVTIETTLTSEGLVISRRAVSDAENDREDSSEHLDDDDEKEFEREITIDLVPEPARSTILREAGDLEIAEVEMVVLRGELFLVYEADWIAGSYEEGVRVSADGRVLAREREKLEARDGER